jgi:hypothetical protein
LYFFSSGGKRGSPPIRVFGSWNLRVLSASETSNYFADDFYINIGPEVMLILGLGI